MTVLVGNTWRRWQDNVKADLKRIWWQIVDGMWISGEMSTR